MATDVSNNKPYYDISKAAEFFEQFMKDFDKQYKDEDDKDKHYQAFIKTLQRINELNTKQDSATYDINKFADYTDDEKHCMCGTARQSDATIED